jgi:hypothetical protein
MNRAAVRICLVLAFALPMIYFAANWANRQGDGGSSNAYDPHRPPGMIVVADRFGAVVQSRVGDLRGVRRDGSTAWTMSRKVLKSSVDPQVICVGQCPAAAVVTNPSETSSVTRWTGANGKTTAVQSAKGETGGPIWAMSADQSIERWEDANFNTSIVFRAPGAEPLRVPLGHQTANVFVNDPGDRAVVLMTDATGNSSRATAIWFERGPRGWQRAGRAAQGRWWHVCMATSGRTLFAGEEVAIANFGSSHVSREPAQTQMSDCVVDRAGFFVSGRDRSRRHTLTITRIAPTGRSEWLRRFPNSFAAISADTARVPHVMAFANKTQTSLLADDGSTAATFSNRLAPFVAPDGAVVSLDRGGKLRWLK